MVVLVVATVVQVVVVVVQVVLVEMEVYFQIQLLVEMVVLVNNLQ